MGNKKSLFSPTLYLHSSILSAGDVYRTMLIHKPKGGKNMFSRFPHNPIEPSRLLGCGILNWEQISAVEMSTVSLYNDNVRRHLNVNS